MSSIQTWFPYLQYNPNASKRLFCFHYASGSAAVFRRWNTPLAPELELWPLQLPGREMRFREPLFTDIKPLVESVVEVMRPLVTEQPYAVFGYSMGSVVAFEVLRALRREGLPMPEHFFPAASRAPHLPRIKAAVSILPEAELLEELRRLDATPVEVLNNRELMELILPILRADMRVCEFYEYADDAPFSFPLTAFGGELDPDIPSDWIHAWAEHTSGGFKSHIFHGKHMFLNEYEPAIWQVIRDTLTP